LSNIFYIDYPQEKEDPKKNIYRCCYCKRDSLSINGLLDNHDLNCKYRIEKEKQIDVGG